MTGNARVGGEFRARFTSGWEGTGRVQACEPPRRLPVLTRGADEPGEQVIEATLTADGDQTILVVGRGRWDIKPRWTELIPVYQALGKVSP